MSAKSSDWDSKGSLKGVESEGGYMSQYDKQRQHKVDYKEYTLDDYKKLKKEVRLGGLGPDLENESFRHKVRCSRCGLYHLIDLKWHHRLVTVFLVFLCKR